MNAQQLLDYLLQLKKTKDLSKIELLSTDHSAIIEIETKTLGVMNREDLGKTDYIIFKII